MAKLLLSPLLLLGNMPRRTCLKAGWKETANSSSKTSLDEEIRSKVQVPEAQDPSQEETSTLTLVNMVLDRISEQGPNANFQDIYDFADQTFNEPLPPPPPHLTPSLPPPKEGEVIEEVIER
uniref:Uncharacterized protein n=1 Tax=Paramoeba aestuarina TaxID=180227 RepID=A0A7S4JKH4_9EUKA